MKITEDLYSYEWSNPFENNCNSFYIGAGAGILVDPGLSIFLEDLLARMEKDGIRRGDIRCVINTHSHPDHFEASEMFDSDERVSIGLLKEEIEFYRNEGREIYLMFGLKAPDIGIDMPLDPGPLTLGGETFEIIHVPGHSPGSLALYWPSRKALFPGDVIFAQNVGRTDFPGGSTELLKDSIRRLSDIEVEYFFPGHLGIIQGSSRIKQNFRIVMDHILRYL